MVDVCYRTSNGSQPTNPPVVTYNDNGTILNLTPAETAYSPSNSSVGANWTETGVYYLFNPPTNVSSGSVGVSFTLGGGSGAIIDSAVDAFSLSGVDTALPPDQLAGTTGNTLFETGTDTNVISASVNGVLPGSWVVGSETFRDQRAARQLLCKRHRHV